MSMDDRDGFIWFDGEMVPWRDARVHVLTHTLHYGMGVFEGVHQMVDEERYERTQAERAAAAAA